MHHSLFKLIYAMLSLALGTLMLACSPANAPDPPTGVAGKQTTAQTPDGRYISWREHLIDDVSISGVPLSGSDGLSVADLDLDGHLDIVSVHESDTEYDGVADGYIRISFGTSDPNEWVSVTLAEGPEAGAAEDVAIDDVNGDGYPDVVAAVELAHLIYLENPGRDARTARWSRHIPSVTTGRGSWIRVFFADFDANGQPEVVAANKGAQDGDAEKLNAISWFELVGDPLEDASWIEHELTRVVWPINSQPVDLDGDGDLDVVGGSVSENRIMWFENITEGTIAFREHPIDISGTFSQSNAAQQGSNDLPEPSSEPFSTLLIPGNSHGVHGFNMDFVDLDQDGRLDIVTNEYFQHLVWLEQPDAFDQPWRLHSIGTLSPDNLVGLAVADIDGDGDPDMIGGGYSRGPRDQDGEMSVNDSLGRLTWFANPGNGPGGGMDHWQRHDISRRIRGMFDKFLPMDMDNDGDIDFASTRGNSVPYDGVFWLEQIRTAELQHSFTPARKSDSKEMDLPADPTAALAQP